MAASSCGEDFSLLAENNYHQTNPNHQHHMLHHPYTSPHRSILPTATANANASPILPDSEEEDEGDGEENETDSPFTDANNPYSDADASNVRTKRRISRQNNPHKRGRSSSAAEYRKDREEWNDAAIGCLLDAYLEKFTQLSRGNLRGRDWEEVAGMVSERCEKQRKSVEQCKNKVDNLKKRYKLERHRITSGSISASHWPWFQKMEEIVGNSLPVKVVVDEDKGSFGGGAGSCTIAVTQAKRYATTTASPVGQTNGMKPKSISSSRWRRVILKISGVALAGSGPNNVNPKVMMLIAREVAIACQLGVEVAIVIGARNFFCGETWVTATGSHQRTTYQIGMVASLMNSTLLQSALEKTGVHARVQTSFAIEEISEPYSRHRAIRHLEKGRVVIFGGIGAGTGNPLFSTDAAAALQASEINAEAVLKGTNVDGVYDCHSRDSNFIFEHISFRDLVSRGATSMDMMALTCCEENNIPVVVFNLLEPGNISKALCGEKIGTLIDQTGRTG